MSEVEETLAKILFYQSVSPGFKWEDEDDWYRDKYRERAREVIKAGYLPVEPVQLEVLSDEEVEKLASKYAEGFDRFWSAGEPDMDMAVTFARVSVMEANNAYNEAKGQLYRRKE